MNEILKQVIEQSIPYVVPTLVTVITGALAWLGKNLFTLVSKKIKESDTKLDDYLAGVAVKWAEDKFSGEKGEAKLLEAKEKLIELSKNNLTDEQADALVRAAFQSISGNMSQLKNAPAPLPTARPR